MESQSVIQGPIKTAKPEDIFNPQSKLLNHPDRLAEWTKKGDTVPISVEISWSNACNARCPWCFYVNHDTKQKHSAEFIDSAVMMRAFDEMHEMGVKAITLTGGGEPTVHPKFEEMVEHAHNLGFRLGIFTNGYKKIQHPEWFDWIRITVTDLFTVPENATFYAGRTYTGVNFNLCKENETQLENLCLLARDRKAHYFQVRPALAARWDLQKEIKIPDHIKKHETENFKVFLTPYKFEDYTQPHPYTICYGHHFTPFIWHNGDVTVCGYHFLKPDTYRFGNLYQQSFHEIWFSERRQKMITQGVPVIKDCQHCCKNNEINKLLANVKSPVKFPDFI